MESGLRAAATQLENRQRRFGLRLLLLPKGDQAREIVGAPTEIGRRLTNAVAYTGRVESTVRREEPETLAGELLQEKEAEAKAAAEKERPGLTMFTDGSRLDDGAAGYAVVWKNGQSWKGIKTHMRFNQEAYDAECAALARALEAAQRRPTKPELVTIFTDAQGAIRRIASDEAGPGQQYALQAGKHIATSREDCCLRIRACSRESWQRFHVAMVLEQEAIARAQAKKTPLGHLMFTDRFRLEDTAVGYPIVWINSQSWVVIKTHVWQQQEGIRRGCQPPFPGLSRPLCHDRCLRDA